MQVGHHPTPAHADRDGCGWPVALEIDVGLDWTSGYYDIVRASSSRAPEAGPAASALALIAHKPGLSIRMLSVGVGLSHAATVRLVDRLSTEGLVERREHSTDGRTRSLHLTEAGKVASDVIFPRFSGHPC